MFLYTKSQHITFSDAAYYADITIFHTLLLNFLHTTYKKAKFRVLLNTHTHTHTQLGKKAQNPLENVVIIQIKWFI